MNKKIIVSLVLVIMGFTTIQAKGIIPIGTTERINVVQDFPDTDEYKGSNGRYLDLGVIYKTFDIAWMPVWVTDKPRIVGLENLNTEIYYNLDDKFIDEILNTHNLKEEDLLKLSFWDKYLGIVVLGGLFIGYQILARIGSDDDEKNEATT